MSLSRSTPMARGNSQMKRTPMARGTSQLARTPFARPVRPAEPPKRKRPKKREGHNEKAMAAARAGGRCYLLMPGVTCGGRLDPCHRNETKGMGLKTTDLWTIPGCRNCHDAYDQGGHHTLQVKRSCWNAGYRAWGPVRDRLFNIPYEPIPEAAQ